MPGWCGDVDGVRPAVEAAVDEGDVPSGHFPNLVAAFARAASICECGETAIGGSSDVVDLPYGCVTEGITAGLVSKPDELAEPAVEVASGRIPPTIGPESPADLLGAVNKRLHHLRPRLLATIPVVAARRIYPGRVPNRRTVGNDLDQLVQDLIKAHGYRVRRWRLGFRSLPEGCHSKDSTDRHDNNGTNVRAGWISRVM
jgi:hypothetical protein